MTYRKCVCNKKFDDKGGKFHTCYDCYLKRRESYFQCMFCGHWHNPRYATCFDCKQTYGNRDDEANDVRMEILVRDNFTCLNCGSNNGTQVDHIKACNGAMIKPWNLQILCATCRYNKNKSEDQSHWLNLRTQLMHLYLTFGWTWLIPSQQDQLIGECEENESEFAWHSHFREVTGEPSLEPPAWAFQMADSEA